MLTLLLLAQAAAVQGAVQGDEVVVRATRRKCDLAVADRVLSDRAFRARAAEWAAGKPVRVVVPPDARVRCLARIMFRLADHGVQRAVFVDQAPSAE